MATIPNSDRSASTGRRGRALRRLAGTVLAIALAAMLAAPIVSAAEPSTPGPVTPAMAARLARLALLRGTVRADLTVVKRDGTTIVVHYERGTIGSLGRSAITIRGRDGKSGTFAFTAATRVRENGHRASIGDLEVGESAAVVGINDNGACTAVLVRALARPAAASRPATGTSPS